MKTGMYKDYEGNLVVEDYLEYLDSYDRGLVPRQKIDVSGVPVDSDELYKIIDEADVNATIRTAMEEKANGSRKDMLKGKFKNPKHLFLFFCSLVFSGWVVAFRRFLLSTRRDYNRFLCLIYSNHRIHRNISGRIRVRRHNRKL